MEKDIGERKLWSLLKQLDAQVFVKSTDSITGKEIELQPSIEDREGTVFIYGEWDREDLKNILLTL